MPGFSPFAIDALLLAAASPPKAAATDLKTFRRFMISSLEFSRYAIISRHPGRRQLPAT
jgi:hypothetical protein